MKLNTILKGDIRQITKTLLAQSVHCIVTSPPYYGLRDYGVEGQIGLEETPQEYVETLVSIFRELRRVLRDDGTVWLNLGDSYSGSWGNYGGQNRGNGQQRTITSGSQAHQKSYDGLEQWRPPASYNLDGLKPKDLIGIPWRVALALQADGWYLRADIIWSKPNPMPESVSDRPTKAHEYIFLLSKSPRYYYDQEAIKEPLAEASYGRAERKQNLIDRTGTGTLGKQAQNGINQDHGYAGLASARNGKTGYSEDGTRNRRTVWTVATQPYSAAHFATFPPDLIRPCILAGCPAKCCADCGAPWVRAVERETYTPPVVEEGVRNVDASRGDSTRKLSGREYNKQAISKTIGFRPTCTCNAPTVSGIVFDPFMGSGTVAQVAIEEDRRWLGCELNQDYIDLAWKRINAAKLAKVAGKDYAKAMKEREGSTWQQVGFIDALTEAAGESDD